MTPAEAKAELERRMKAGSFRDFVQEINPGLLHYEHIPRLVDVADRVARGVHRRVLVLLPPRYFKSETFSRLLPAYFLHRNPHASVGLASYSSNLAWDLSGDAKAYYEMAGGDFAADTQGKREWATPAGGEMWAEGTDGSLTGRGFHLGIIDDPMKPQHVRSSRYIERFRHFFPEVWYNRQEPGARMVIVMQRLGAADPIDFLYRREVGDGDNIEESPERWHVVCCDEIKSDEPLSRYDGPKGLPPTCTLEPDDRPVGMILAPSRFPADEVQKQQAAATPDARAAQRQQRASEARGDVWRKAWFTVYGTVDGDPYDDLPPGTVEHGYDWDTAYTKNDANSASAYVYGCRRPRDDRPDSVYVMGAGFRWLEFPELVSWMQSLGGPHFVEAKASGKSVVQTLARNDVPAVEVDVEGGDKLAKTQSVQPLVGTILNDVPISTNRVYVHASVWERMMKSDRQGLLTVTYEDLRTGTGDLDLNDAFCQMLNRLAADSSPFSFSVPKG